MDGAVTDVSPCWEHHLTFFRCCLLEAVCWEGVFTYDYCCKQKPLLTFYEHWMWQRGDLSCGCPEFTSAATDGRTSGNLWCMLQNGLVLQQGQLPFMKFRHLSADSMALCPVGSMVLFVAYMTQDLGGYEPVLAYLSEAFVYLYKRLPDVVRGGWSVLFIYLTHVAHLRNLDELRLPQIAHPCNGVHGSELHLYNALPAWYHEQRPPSLRASMDLLHGSIIVNNKKCFRIVDGIPVPACCMAPAVAALAVASVVEEENIFDHYLHVASQYLVTTQDVPWVALLPNSVWPLQFVLSIVAFSGIVHVRLDEVTNFASNDWPDDLLRLLANQTYQMRIFRKPEMVSNLIRATRAVSCHQTILLKYVRALANYCYKSGHRCGNFTMLEAGAHLGDCSLWSTAVLRMVSVRHHIMAVEPQIATARLLTQSLMQNDWLDMVDVVPAALGSTSGHRAELKFNVGQGAQASFVREQYEIDTLGELEMNHPSESVPIMTIDELWIGSRLDVLKMSVTGFELEVLRGATQLLSANRICSVLVNMLQLTTGWEGLTSASELISIFQGMNLLLHVTDSDVRTMRTPSDLNVAADELTVRRTGNLVAYSGAEDCSFARKHLLVALFGEHGGVSAPAYL